MRPARRNARFVLLAPLGALALAVALAQAACADDPPSGSSGLPGDVPRVVTDSGSDAPADAPAPSADGATDAPVDATKG
jgi:hypothetical protein